MRAIFFAIFFALLASPAIADEINDVVTNLPSGWDDNQMGTLIMPTTASTNDVLQIVLRRILIPNCDEITNFTVLKSRQIAIPSCRGYAPVYSYTAVLVQVCQGEKVVVLLRSIDVDGSRAWLSSVFVVWSTVPMTPASSYALPKRSFPGRVGSEPAFALLPPSLRLWRGKGSGLLALATE